jgi:hypothetical protein
LVQVLEKLYGLRRCDMERNPSSRTVQPGKQFAYQSDARHGSGDAAAGRTETGRIFQ